MYQSILQLCGGCSIRLHLHEFVLDVKDGSIDKQLLLRRKRGKEGLQK